MKQNSKPVVIDGLEITPSLIANLKDLLDPDAKDAKDCISRNNLFIISLPWDDINQVERSFFNYQRIFYNILCSLEGSDEERSATHE
jgi:hypothetical protein